MVKTSLVVSPTTEEAMRKKAAKRKKQKRPSTSIPEDEAYILKLYNARDNVIQRKLYSRYKKRLRTEIPNGEATHKLLTKLQLIGDEMCWRGIGVDNQARKAHLKELTSRIQKALGALDDVSELSGFGPLNPNSNPQLKRFFFDHCGASPQKWSEETGEPSLDESVLEVFRTDTNPVVAQAATQMLKLRQWNTLLRTHVKGLPVRRGLVHPFWRPGGAITGRWSCSSPNLMNVPKPIEKTVGGKRIIVHPGLRDMYLPTAPDGWWVEVDYKQIEARIVAILSGDKPSLHAFNSGADPHSDNAYDLFYDWSKKPKVVTKDDVSKKERTLAKNFCYLCNYGGKPEKLWRTISPTVPEFTLSKAQKLHKRYFKAHPAIKRWQENLLATAEATGYVDEPLSGKRRYFWGPINPNEVYNFPVQTAAGYVINEAIQKVNRRLRWPDEGILMQLHDALHVDGKNPYRLANILTEEMQIEVKLNGQKIAFPIDLSVGRNWAYTEEMSLEDTRTLVKKASRTLVDVSANRVRTTGKRLAKAH